MHARKPIIDGFHRTHTNLRLSVTDRCNIRCFYCMPAENIQFRPRHELLTFEEITRFVAVLATMGIDRIRLTGGEPLVRSDLATLVRMLTSIDGIRDVALTTNGLLLAEQANDLRAAGLSRLNVSLDTLSETTFQQISRRPGLHRVLDGIAAAQSVGFKNIRLNALAIRDLTENEVASLIRFAIDHDLELRFIEFMPLDADSNWESNRVLSGAEVRAIIEAEFGRLIPVRRDDTSQPAVDYQFERDPNNKTDNGDTARPRIGLINPVTEPFCGDCNRLRLTADGQVRNCLFSSHEWDVRSLLRAGDTTDNQIAELVYECVASKQPGHGIDSPDFLKPQRAMYQIGG